MKNIRLTINPDAVTSLAPPLPYPPAAQMQQLKQIYSVSLNVQFENEAEALNFATKLINVITGDSE